MRHPQDAAATAGHHVSAAQLQTPRIQPLVRKESSLLHGEQHHPGRPLEVGVAGPVEAQVGPIGGDAPRLPGAHLESAAHRLVVGHAHGAAARADLHRALRQRFQILSLHAQYHRCCQYRSRSARSWLATQKRLHCERAFGRIASNHSH